MEEIVDTENLYVYCDEFGRIENQDPEKVYFANTGSTIKVILPPGALELHNATMIINLPYVNEDQSIIYTMVSPFKSGKPSAKVPKVEEIKDDTVVCKKIATCTKKMPPSPKKMPLCAKKMPPLIFKINRDIILLNFMTN